MKFEPNQLLNLPGLAAEAGLASSEFRTDRVLTGGMGECARAVQGDQAFALKVTRMAMLLTLNKAVRTDASTDIA